MSALVLLGPTGFTLEIARRGEIVEVPAIDGQTERMMLLSACDGDLMHAFYCETCRANFANTYNLRLHVEKGGKHRIAVWCSKRRIYEPADVHPTRAGAAARMTDFATNLIINGPKIGGSWDAITRGCERAIQTVKPGTIWKRRGNPDSAGRIVARENIGLTRVTTKPGKPVRGDVFLKDFVPVDGKP
jgi:hypothetical protein